MRILLPISLILVGILTACQPNQKESNNPFELYFDFDAEIERLEALNPMVEKTVTTAGETESRTDSVANWEKELSLFIQANINRPNYKDVYKQSTEETHGGKVVTYSAISEDLDIQEVRMKYKGEYCEEVYIRKKLQNQVYESFQELIYEPGKSYTIRSKQRARVALETSVEVHGRILQDVKEWRAELDLGHGDILPFNFEMSTGNLKKIVIHNADEQIRLESVRLDGDSIFAHLPVFDSEIRARITEIGLEGHWYNYAKKGYRIPIAGLRGKSSRFDLPEKNHPADFRESGKCTSDLTQIIPARP